MARILIVQPGVPEYRRAFFEAVIQRAEDAGHEVLVLTTSYKSAQSRARADVVELPWQRRGRGFSTYLRGLNLRYRGSKPYQDRADLIVVELATGCLDTHYAVVRRSLSRLLPNLVRAPRVIVWGHVGSYVRSRGQLLNTVENLLLRGADHVLAYTEKGRFEAVRRGAAPASVSALNNTVDLDDLANAVEEVVRSQLTSSEAWHRLCGEPSVRSASMRAVAFIGGLDAPKRIDFLASALERVWEHDRSVKLLVGGTGVDEHLLQPSVERGQTVLLGRIGSSEKALLSRSASALLMPGRVGLIAAESFVLGLPVLTTDHPWHAPEFDYLRPPRDSMILADDPKIYADQLMDLLNDRQTLEQMQARARARSGWPTLEHMVQTFVDACNSTLTRPTR